MARSTGNKLADRLTEIIADAKRLGYSDEQAMAMANEELERGSTYDAALAADALTRAVHRS